MIVCRSFDRVRRTVLFLAVSGSIRDLRVPLRVDLASHTVGAEGGREGRLDDEPERRLRRDFAEIFVMIRKKILLFWADQLIFSAGLRSSARPNTAERGL